MSDNMEKWREVASKLQSGAYIATARDIKFAGNVIFLACKRIDELEKNLAEWATEYHRWTVENVRLIPEAEVLKARVAKLEAVAVAARKHAERWPVHGVYGQLVDDEFGLVKALAALEEK